MAGQLRRKTWSPLDEMPSDESDLRPTPGACSECGIRAIDDEPPLPLWAGRCEVCHISHLRAQEAAAGIPASQRSHTPRPYIGSPAVVAVLNTPRPKGSRQLASELAFRTAT